MNEHFRNQIGKNTAKITFESKGRTIDVYFQLNDNPVQHIWQEIQNRPLGFETYPMSDTDLNMVIEKLNSQLTLVGVEKIYQPVNIDQLNYIHSLFVKSQSESPEIWQKINLLIHSLENLIDDPLPEYSRSINFIRDYETRLPIKEEYKMWLTTEFRWGDLILGYGTKGKDWLEIFRNNDSLEELVLQTTISSETHMHFHPEHHYKRFEEKDFYRWAKSKNINLDNLNSLALGNYILGQIIITDNFLSYHNNLGDWYIPNHICKLNWNKEFIGDDTKVVAIDFFDSDMYFEHMLKHSRLLEIMKYA
jgi:hypothetical protein